MEKLRCSCCGEEKQTNEFSIRSDRKRGFLSRCKKCQSHKSGERIKNNRRSKYINSEKYKLLSAGFARCTKCNIVKPLDKNNFTIEPRCKSGFGSHCRTCQREHSKKVMERKRNDPKTKDIIKDSKNRHRKSDKGREGHRKRSAIRNHLYRGNTFEWTKEQWERCKLYFGNKCVYCESEEFLTQDHFIPLSNNNCIGTVERNIVPACVKCNSSKGSKHPEDWCDIKSIKRITEYFNNLD